MADEEQERRDREKHVELIQYQLDKVSDAQREFDSATGPVTRYTNDMEAAGRRRQSAGSALSGAEQDLRDAEGIYDAERGNGLASTAAENARDRARGAVRSAEQQVSQADRDVDTATSNYNEAARTLERAQSALLAAQQKLSELRSSQY